MSVREGHAGNHTARRRVRLTGKGQSAPFLMVPRDVLDSAIFGSLSGWGVKLLLELGKQYRGYNNGDFSATFKGLRSRGWNSSGTLTSAAKELQAAGFIVKTRQGGKNQCNLYAITWWPIDDCDGKIEWAAEKIARNDWKNKIVPA
jgi:hypothetical protein